MKRIEDRADTEIEAIENDESLSEDEKRKLIREIYKEMKQMLKEKEDE